jgi:DNA polymerase/3'-5' exonuclease PolX
MQTSNGVNQKIAKILKETGELLDIKGVAFKPKAYRKAAENLEKLDKDVAEIYKTEGLKGLGKIPGVGKSIAQKIEEYLKKKKIKYYEELKKETAIRKLITYYFETKGVDLAQLKKDARKRRIIYSRFTKSAKQLLELAGSIENAEKAIKKVAEWAKSRNLDYAIETVFKKWLELDRLKPKEIVKKPYYKGNPMIWSKTKRKWYVIDPGGDWLEFAAKEEDMEWRIEK